METGCGYEVKLYLDKQTILNKFRWRDIKNEISAVGSRIPDEIPDEALELFERGLQIIKDTARE